MKKALLVFCLSAAVICCCVLLAACSSQDGFERTAQQFFSALENRDYDTIYSLMTPASEAAISREKLGEYYDKVYDMLQVGSIEVQTTERVEQDRDCVFNYKLILHSEQYGTLEYDSTITVRCLLDFYLIDWTPSNVVPGMDYYDTIHKVTLKGIRGEIFDCNGAVLVKNSYAVTVYFNLNKTEDFSASASALAEVLSLEAAQLLNDMNKAAANGNDTVVAATYVPGELSAAKEEAALAIDGVRVDRSSITPIRQAVYDSAAAHLIGYSTPVTAEDRQNEKYALLSGNTRIGRTGIEYIYDDILRGTDGVEIYLRSADSTRKTVLYRQDAGAGQDVVLTIDINLQLELEEQMQQYKSNGSTGAVVVNDPDTGAVKAMASYPSFDLNIYAAPVPKKEAAELVKDESLPLLNRATQGLYPPGSVCKTLSAIAGLESGTVTMSTAFPYENEIVKVTDKTDGWRPAGSNWSHMIIREHMRNSASYGALNMDRALVFSDNIYFGWMGMQVGAENLIQWYERLGIGEQVPFELSVKKSQISNDPENSKLYSNQKFLADTSVGHGELLITPFQLSVIFSLYGNSGTVMQPYCVEKLCTTDELGRHETQWQAQTAVYKQQVCSRETVEKISQSLCKVTVDGTGKPANVKGMTLVAKTGTAQKSETEEIGWMAGYIKEGGVNYSLLVCVNGPKDDTGGIKTSVAKGIFTYLKYDGQ
ncbi:MAG: penicillin-binding transpeptidase domain-containing protein [Firmicutes bacterium]|nr:penicillin-binding transpeptidase domain-containing protein [Bacillota bacterium]